MRATSVNSRMTRFDFGLFAEAPSRRSRLVTLITTPRVVLSRSLRTIHEADTERPRHNIIDCSFAPKQFELFSFSARKLVLQFIVPFCASILKVRVPCGKIGLRHAKSRWRDKGILTYQLRVLHTRSVTLCAS
jgi:hypothetical protein